MIGAGVWASRSEAAGMAGAARSFLAAQVGSLLYRNTPPLSFLPIDEAARDINALTIETSMANFGSDIYTCYIDGKLRVVVAKSADDGRSWQKAVVHAGVRDDSHYVCNIGVDRRGYIHIAYDMHGEPLRYQMSRRPRDISAFATGTMPMAENQVTYPRFYRAPTGEFYFFYRNGSAGEGDLYMKRLNDSGAWVNVGAPLLKGRGLAIEDNAYASNAAFDASGNLHLAWVYKTGWYTYGMGYGYFDRATQTWRRISGQPYALPITRDSADIIVPSGEQNGLSYVGLSLTIDQDGRPHIVYLEHAADGYREVFHVSYSATKWRKTQVTDLNTSRLRACPVGPQDGAPRPCDMEIGGPVSVIDRTGTAYAFFTKAQGDSRGIWARPPGVLLFAKSVDGGRTWTAPQELKLPVSGLGAEFTYDQNYFAQTGLFRLFFQIVGQPVAPLYLATVDLGRLIGTELQPPPSPAPVPVLRFDFEEQKVVDGMGSNAAAFRGSGYSWTSRASGTALVLSGRGDYVEVADSDRLRAANGFTFSAWVRPEGGARRTLVDKGGLLNDREFRIRLYNAGTAYDASRIQVLIGDSEGVWHPPTNRGLLWYPALSVPAGTWTHLSLVWDGTTAKLYQNGELATSTPYSVPQAVRNGSGTMLIGALKDGAGVPGDYFAGGIDAVRFFDRPLQASEVRELAR
jgi:hypothetical protein